jgi:large subunit ribosomal protein L25
MANYTTIEAVSRERAGKGAARATRRAGKVPAVIYGARQAPTLIALDPRDVLRELHKPGWRSRLFQITDGADPVRALIRDVQYHPVTDQPLHVDFQRLAAGEHIHVAVQVSFQNEGLSPGLKRGGVLNIVRHTVEVMVDPDHIPEKFEADLGGLEINDNIRWADLKGTGEARPLIADRNFVVATVAPGAKMEAAEAAPTAPGAAPAPAAKGGRTPPAKAPAKPAAKK